MRKPSPEFSPRNKEEELIEILNPEIKTSELAQDLASDLRIGLAKLIQQELDNLPSVSNKEKKQALQYCHDSLLVETYNSPERIKECLDNHGYGELSKIYPDEALLMIRLPEPMEAWPMSEREDETKIPWEDIYEKITPEMWRIRNTFRWENQINIERVNPPSIHKPKEYYYLWLMSPIHRDKIDYFPPEGLVEEERQEAA